MRCSYCERACDIQESQNGYCRMYRNSMGTITENYPDRYLNIYPVSSESIPVLHFYPNSIFLLISTIGCNFACEGCISEFQTIRNGTLQEILNHHTPEEILAIARGYSCRGITFCLNEPTVSLPTFLKVAQAAKKEGFLTGCSTNGYMTEETLQKMLPYLDFVNIGLKGSTDERYRECGAVSAAPTYRNLKTLFDAGVAVEVSVMYLNGREQEVIGAAERVRAISPSIPFQVMRFMATHESLEPIAPTRAQGEQLCTVDCAGILITCTCSTHVRRLNWIHDARSAGRQSSTGSSSARWLPGCSHARRTANAAAVTNSPSGVRSIPCSKAKSRFLEGTGRSWACSLSAKY